MGKRAFSKPPSKLVNKALGGLPLRKKAQDVTQGMDRGMGNKPTGFIQTTPKKATGAMMGRSPPKAKGKKPPAQKGRSQFAPKAGSKVF